MTISGKSKVEITDTDKECYQKSYKGTVERKLVGVSDHVKADI